MIGKADSHYKITRDPDAMAIALYFAKAGDVEETFAWMERAYQNRLSGVHTLGQSSFDPYRDDPRFVDLFRKIGIPEEVWQRLGVLAH